MKINRGRDVKIYNALVFIKGEEILILKDGVQIKVITDNTEFDEVLEGEFTFAYDDAIEVNGTSIHIDYIEEIIVL